VKQSDGCIFVESAPGQGARFEVYLPRVDEPVVATRSEAGGALPASRGKTVLLAEDEEAVRELACEFLKSAGYTVLAAQDGEEALEMARLSDDRIDAVLTDVVMPNMRGPEFTKRVREIRPGVKVIYMSGYLDYEKGNGEFLEDGFFLQKPFSRDVLIRKVDEALGSRASEEPAAQLIEENS
jgi:two-component system, cell cycle sensor histidine kinase and response regulator CckA